MVAYIHALFVVVAAYLVGALPVGFWLAQLRGVTDIRSHGSGNIGATNVARVLGGRYFVPVFLFDCLKAALFVWVLAVYAFDYSLILLSCALLLIGNGFSLFLQGSGGKGVATTVGILIVLDHIGALVFCSAWALVLACTRTVGIASVAASLLLPGYAWYMSYDMSMILLYVFISAWILWRHWDNIHSYYVRRLSNEIY